MVSLDQWVMRAGINKSRLRRATLARILERLLFAWIWGTAAAFLAGAVVLLVAGVLGLGQLLVVYVGINVFTLALAAVLYAVQREG